MSSSLVNILTYLWLGGSLCAMLVGAVSLIQAVVGTKGPQRNRRLLRFGMSMGAIPVLFGLYLAILRGVVIPADQRRAEREAVDSGSSVHVGDAAPHFSIKDTQGREFSLSAQRGKAVILNFFATWCGPCVQEMPTLQDLWDEYGGRDDFAMLMIGREETDEAISAFQSKHGATIPMEADVDQSAYSLYAEQLIPRTYVVSRDRTICFAGGVLNPRNRTALRRELAAQLMPDR